MNWYSTTPGGETRAGIGRYNKDLLYGDSRPCCRI